MKNIKFYSQRKNDKKYETTFEKTSKGRKFKCNVCQRKLCSKETLRRHILVKHIKLKPHSCETCSKQFIFQRSLALHMDTHSEFPLYRCSSCDVTYKKRSSLLYHKRQSHGGSSSFTQQCTYCYKTFVGKQKLEYHMHLNHVPKTIRCRFVRCLKFFSTNWAMQKHLRFHSLEKHSCDICGKSFKLKSYLAKHQTTHTGHRPYACPDCNKSYLFATHLELHRKRVHSAITSSFLCSFCGKNFMTNYELGFHENAHKGEEPFQCEVCDYRTSCKSTLFHHRKTHSKSTVQKVTHQKTYSQAQSYKLGKSAPHYTLVSDNDRGFQCVDCDKSFPSAVRANEHWRRHHVVKNEFKCPFCPQIFTSKEEMVAHRGSHQGEHHFKCERCEYKTPFRIALMSHLRSHSQRLHSSFKNDQNRGGARKEAKRAEAINHSCAELVDECDGINDPESLNSVICDLEIFSNKRFSPNWVTDPDDFLDKSRDLSEQDFRGKFSLNITTANDCDNRNEIDILSPFFSSQSETLQITEKELNPICYEGSSEFPLDDFGVEWSDAFEEPDLPLDCFFSPSKGDFRARSNRERVPNLTLNSAAIYDGQDDLDFDLAFNILI